MPVSRRAGVLAERARRHEDVCQHNSAELRSTLNFSGNQRCQNVTVALPLCQRHHQLCQSSSCHEEGMESPTTAGAQRASVTRPAVSLLCTAASTSACNPPLYEKPAHCKPSSSALPDQPAHGTSRDSRAAAAMATTPLCEQAALEHRHACGSKSHISCWRPCSGTCQHFGLAKRFIQCFAQTPWPEAMSGSLVLSGRHRLAHACKQTPTWPAQKASKN